MCMLSVSSMAFNLTATKLRGSIDFRCNYHTFRSIAREWCGDSNILNDIQHVHYFSEVKRFIVFHRMQLFYSISRYRKIKIAIIRIYYSRKRSFHFPHLKSACDIGDKIWRKSLTTLLFCRSTRICKHEITKLPISRRVDYLR